MKELSAVEEFVTELRRLHEAAGRPKYSVLVQRGKAQQPPIKLTSSTLSDWLGSKASLPRNTVAVRFLVEHLEPLAAARNKGHQEHDARWWLRRLQHAWDEQHATRAGRAPDRTPAASPPGRAVVAQQLPSAPNRFTGRADTLAALDQLLRTSTSGGGTVRPIVIAAVHGTGGIGKTALAVHWAHQVRHQFPDGQLFVNLRGYGPGEPLTPSAALEILLRSLDVPAQQIPADLDARSALLRSLLADQRILLLLDNARDSAQVRPLLPGSSCLVVVTSRDQLRGLVAVDGAQRISLNKLPPAESVKLLKRVLPARPRPYDETALAELARLCGHLPLALRIAADAIARNPETGLHEIVRDLRQRSLDVLDTEDPAANLRRVFSWSCKTLDPETTRTFRLLGAHPGPSITLPAAAALIGSTPAQVRQLLDRLIDAHLAEKRRQSRYEQHDLIRIYASELANTADHRHDRDAALRRVFAFYIHSGRNANAALGRGEPLTPLNPIPDGVTPLEFPDDRQALAWLDAMRETAVAAVELAADLGLDRAAYELGEMLSLAFLYWGATRDLLRVREIGLACARRVGDSLAEAEATKGIGVAHLALGNPTQGIAHQQHALELFERAGSVRGQATALGNLGGDYLALRRLPEAARILERSVDLARQAGDRATEATQLNNLANVYIGMRQYDKAVTAARQALNKCRGTIRILETYTLDTLGDALTKLHRHDEAVTTYQQALTVARELGGRWHEVIMLTNLAIAQQAAQHLDDARHNGERALGILNDLGIDDIGGTSISRATIENLLANLKIPTTTDSADQQHDAPAAQNHPDAAEPARQSDRLQLARSVRQQRRHANPRLAGATRLSRNVEDC